MARIRTVKPEFWTDAAVGECSVSARLLLIASLNFADDYGGLDRSAKQLKAQAFPYDNIDCEPLVQELIRNGLFVEYEVSERIYLHIKGFRKHQRVENPAKPRIPLYETTSIARRTITEDSPRTHRGVTVSSLEGNGKEGKGSRSAVAPTEAQPTEDSPKPSRGTRLPEDFLLIPERQQIASDEGLDPTRTFAKFRDYWVGVAGAKGLKLDWDATWRNWCRKEADSKPARRSMSVADRITYRPTE